MLLSLFKSDPKVRHTLRTVRQAYYRQTEQVAIKHPCLVTNKLKVKLVSH